MYSRNSFGSYYPISSTIHKLNPIMKLINFIIKLRSQAREEKRYDLSDEIRDELIKMGITLKDSREGTTYEK